LENKRILKLIAKEQLSVISEEEQKELDEWIESSPLNRQFYDRFINEEDPDDKNDGQYSADASWKRFEKNYGTISLNMPKRRWWKESYIPYVAAACIILIISAVLFYRPNFPKTSSGKCIAVIKRSDGAILKVYDSEKKVLADAEGIQIINEGNGRLKYKRYGSNLNLPVTTFDTIITPVGGKCEVLLVDGSKVCLNALSTLGFPANLNDEERLVTLSGEGYFDVNSKYSPVLGNKIPFVVDVNGSKVNVLGTRFNIKAYDDEQIATTTLFEGSVKIVTKDSSAVLKPGQQVKVNKKGGLSIVKPNNLDNAVAWEKGEMTFEDNSLDEIMRQASRWYEMDFVCEKNCNEHFKATISKKESLMSFLQALENTGQVHFKIEGKKIIAR
jgi:transmembrane sensor